MLIVVDKLCNCLFNIEFRFKVEWNYYLPKFNGCLTIDNVPVPL